MPPLHGPFTNIRQLSSTAAPSSSSWRAKSSEAASRPTAGRRSRHSSQGSSSRPSASGTSNNTSVDDYRYSYKVEDTPVTFSRNSSLSSLSVNSNDDEPSAEDQALLDSCISSAMPKSKSDLMNRPPSLDLNASVFFSISFNSIPLSLSERSNHFIRYKFNFFTIVFFSFIKFGYYELIT